MSGEPISNWIRPITGLRSLDRDVKKRLQQLWSTKQNHVEVWELSGDYFERPIHLVLFTWVGPSERGAVKVCGTFEVWKEIVVPADAIRCEAVLLDRDKDAALAIVRKGGAGLILMGFSVVVVAAEPVRTSA